SLLKLLPITGELTHLTSSAENAFYGLFGRIGLYRETGGGLTMVRWAGHRFASMLRMEQSFE
ncbi:hypothetical protein L9F63_009588, partial [Diploptera punctata]